MEPCCPKMAELLPRRGSRGVAAQLPDRAGPRANRMRDTAERLPALVFSPISHEAALAFEGRLPDGLMVECMEYINFCPYCGQDWRLPSVAGALERVTAPGLSDPP